MEGEQGTGRKRSEPFDASDTSEVPLDAPCRRVGVDSSAKVTIREIKITHFASSTSFTKQPKKKKPKPANITGNAEPVSKEIEKEWWKVTYTVFLNNVKSSNNRMKISSTKDVWNDDSPSLLMMEKVHTAIK